MPLKSLPVGIQEFSDLIENNHVYVDKTQAVHALLSQVGCPYFLTRPRRFGKSLLISTLAALFQGRKELFKDLWIGQEGRWDWSKTYPVIRLDMTEIPRSNPQELRRGLVVWLREVIKEHQLTNEIELDQPPAGLLRDTIRYMSKETQSVLLVDEYDAPLVDHLRGGDEQEWRHNLKIAEANRQVLKDFYGVLKAQGRNLRFLLVTGVSKFAKVSVFSELNHLTDLSLSTRAATLLGYTQQELERDFAPHLRQLAEETGQTLPQVLREIKRWYDGFRFSSRDVHVYNPFSTLLLLQEREFRAHWFQTGTPSFLVHLIKRVEDPQPMDLAGAKVAQRSFDSYELNKLPQNLLPLMVQTGYLTIADHDAATRRYTVDYPNQEVREGFLESLLESYANLPKGQAVTDLDRLTDALAEADLDQFFVALRRVLAGVPYEPHIGLEKYYQSLFYLIHVLLGFRIQTEVRINTGRIDAVIDLDTHTYIFEFKLEPGNPT
ncbi:MAG: AAA family ATPase, partial [Myxococcota bacterium]